MKKNVIKYLEFSCSRFPGKTAVIDEAESLTYAELLRRSRIIGSAIARRSQPRSPVPVLMDKSAVALAAFLGIAYADCFYVLLNPGRCWTPSGSSPTTPIGKLLSPSSLRTGC